MSLLSPVALTNAQEAVEELFFFCGTASVCGLDDAIEKHRLLILEELLQKKNCRIAEKHKAGWVTGEEAGIAGEVVGSHGCVQSSETIKGRNDKRLHRVFSFKPLYYTKISLKRRFIFSRNH